MLNKFAVLAVLLLISLATARAADITVGDECTLADAIESANSDAAVGGCPAGDGEDVIMLAGDVAVTGMLPPITSPIIIQGKGYTLSGAKRDRFLRIVAGQVAIHDLTLEGGKREPDFGGAIRVESGASLRVFDSVFQGNSAHTGGAIASFGHLEIENTTFSNNRATSEGGAVFREGGGLSVVDSVFEGNSAGHNGGAINFSDGVGSVTDSRFSGNETDWSGGAIAVHEAILTIANSVFQGNRADGNGGAINTSRSGLTFSKGSMINNSAGFEGGALKSWYDTVDISESVISGNKVARVGGGIHSSARDMLIHASIISDNSGERAGGLFTDVGNHRISGSSFRGNRATDRGGAVYNKAGRLFIHNSTFYRNTASYSGGALYLKETSDLAHVTIAHNSAGEGGGIYAHNDTTRLSNSILAGNGGQDCHAMLVKNVGNLVADGTCNPTLRGDPLLVGLWGAPAVIVPANNSPVIDAGNPAECLASDQLGRHRVWGDSCDLGAFELDPSEELDVEGLDQADRAEPKQDAVAGIVVTEGCSLRDAIVSANRDWAVGGCPAGKAGADIITLTLDVTLNADLPYIASEITIEGAGHTISGADRYAIFQVYPGPLTLNDLTMTKGVAVGGGAIGATDGIIRLNRSKVIGNRSVGSILADGGGIYCFPCTLIIKDSLIANNSTEQSGGGISWHGHTEIYYLEIQNSVIDGNRAVSGGGLVVAGSDSLQRTLIRNTTISRNSAKYDGGGIEASVGRGKSYLSISNSTIYGNRAGGNGGGIFTANSGSTRLKHVTITDNGAESGGGVFTQDDGATQLSFSIIAGNSGNDCVGYPEHNFASIIADGSCNSPLRGDPRLAEWVKLTPEGQSYFPLAPDSPAIDAPFDAQCDGGDQIGTPRPQGGACDIGAIEYIPSDSEI